MRANDDGKTRILFLAANPEDTDQLQLIKEYKNIRDELLKVQFRDLFDLRIEPATSLRELAELLQIYKPRIVHFSGHGSKQGTLLFENQDGQTEEASPEDLAHLFGILRRNIMCVLLNACYSERQAEPISDHIPCVIGMNTAISDSAAIIFAETFYRHAGYGENLNDAFNLACLQLKFVGISEEHTPILKCKSGDPSQLFLVQIRQMQPQETATQLDRLVNYNHNENSICLALTLSSKNIELWYNALVRIFSKEIANKLTNERVTRDDLGNLINFLHRRERPTVAESSTKLLREIILRYNAGELRLNKPLDTEKISKVADNIKTFRFRVVETKTNWAEAIDFGNYGQVAPRAISSWIQELDKLRRDIGMLITSLVLDLGCGQELMNDIYRDLSR